MSIFDNNFDNSISNESIRLVASPSKTARKAFLYMLETGYIEDDFSRLDALDISDCFLILYTISGEGRLVYDGKEYKLKKESLFLIECNKYYKCLTDDPKKWHIIYLYFNGYQAKEYYNIIMKNNTHVFKVDNPKTITSIYWQIINLHKNKNTYTEILTSLHITKLLTEVVLFNANTQTVETEYPDFLNEMFYYIKRHYTEKITLDMLAKRYNINKYHLAKVFKRYSGTTIKEYIITNRMDRAKALLRYTDKSVEDIAAEVGFYDATHFIKMFREREKVTPMLYRKMFIKIK